MLTLHAADIFTPNGETHFAIHSMTDRELTRLHDHDFCELFAIDRGTIVHVVNGTYVPLVRGALVLIRPQDQHFYRPVDPASCTLLNLAFTVDILDNILAYLDPALSRDGLFASPMPPMVMLPPTALDELRREFDALYDLPQSIPVDIRRRAIVRARLADLIARNFAYPPIMPPADLPAWLALLCDQMREPAHFIEGRPALLRLAARSEEHIARSFRAHLNITPSAFINNLRLDHAARLLIQTDQPIVTIVYEVGFQNLSHFYRLFYTRWQLSPRDYRHRHRDGLIPPR